MVPDHAVGGQATTGCAAGGEPPRKTAVGRQQGLREGPPDGARQAQRPHRTALRAPGPQAGDPSPRNLRACRRATRRSSTKRSPRQARAGRRRPRPTEAATARGQREGRGDDAARGQRGSVTDAAIASRARPIGPAAAPPPRRGGGFVPGLIGGLLGGAAVVAGWRLVRLRARAGQGRRSTGWTPRKPRARRQGRRSARWMAKLGAGRHRARRRSRPRAEVGGWQST